MARPTKIQKYLTDWADCATTGCPHKVCTWGSEILCYPCEERIVGKEEMDRRYDATHERPLSAPIKPGVPNYMTKTYNEARDD